MDLRIGVTDTPREIELNLADDTDRDALKQQIEAALAGDTSTLWLTDRKGREVAIPSVRIAYIDLGSAAEPRPMGFSS